MYNQIMTIFRILLLLIFHLNGAIPVDFDQSDFQSPPFYMPLKAGIQRTALSLVIEQPFDLLISRIQAKEGHQNTRQILQQGWQEHGCQFILKGIVPKFQTIVLRNAYTWIIYSQIPPLYHKIWESCEKKSSKNGERLALGMLWGATSALIDTPFERRRVQLVLGQKTQQKNHPIPFFHQMYYAYRGIGPSFGIGAISCSIYLMLEQNLRDFFKKHQEQHPLKYYHFMATGFILGTVNVTLTTPLVMLRTMVQKQTQAKSLSTRQIFDRFCNLGAKQALRTLYIGWPLRLYRSAILSTFDSYWLNQIEGS